MVSVEIVQFDGIAKPLGHLSNGTRVGKRLYLAGLVALNERGELVGEGSIRAQTLHVCRSIERRACSSGRI